VTLENFLRENKLLPRPEPETDAVVILIGDVYEQALSLIEQLRRQGANVAVDATDRKLDAKIRHAVKSGVRYALFAGEKELTDGKFKLRDLKKGEEHTLTPKQAASTLSLRRNA
jgi:histidyl-tRNA synthetase